MATSEVNSRGDLSSEFSWPTMVIQSASIFILVCVRALNGREKHLSDKCKMYIERVMHKSMGNHTTIKPITINKNIQNVREKHASA